MKKIFAVAAAVLTLFTSCVKDEIYPYAAIADLEYTYAYDAATPVVITVKLNSFVDINSVKLFYTAGTAAEKSVDMTKGSDGAYTGTIPAFPMGTDVTYYVKAATAAGETTSAVTKYTVGVTPPNYAAIKLNELNGNDKFIELYNSGGSDVDIEGMFITKDSGEKATWTAPKKTLAPGDFLLLYSEDVTIPGGAQEGYEATLVFASGLSPRKAVRISLFNPSGKCVDDFNLVDCKEKCAASYSRVPDGTGSWYHTASTPNAANDTNTAKAVEGLQ